LKALNRPAKKVRNNTNNSVRKVCCIRSEVRKGTKARTSANYKKKATHQGSETTNEELRVRELSRIGGNGRVVLRATEARRHGGFFP
jgi:hypothetical protein